jgi:hypothetical protein
MDTMENLVAERDRVVVNVTPQVSEQAVGLEVTSYLPAEIDII